MSEQGNGVNGAGNIDSYGHLLVNFGFIFTHLVCFVYFHERGA